MLLDCQWCAASAAQLKEDDLIIKSRHHGRWHFTNISVSRLVSLAAQSEDTIIECSCGCSVARAGNGEVVWWVRHNGHLHTQVWPILRLSTLNTCEKLVLLKEQIGDDLPYLEASGVAFVERDTTRRLGRLIQTITKTLQS